MDPLEAFALLKHKLAEFLAGDSEWLIHRGDCHDVLAELPNGVIPLTVSSPPYFIGKSYDRSKKLADFQREHQLLAPQLSRITRDGGSLCWQVGNHVEENAVTPLDFAAHEIFSKEPDLTLRNRIIWHFGHGVHATRRFSGRHEAVLWYSKGDDYLFNLDPVRVPQKYPGKRHYKGPKQGQYSGHPAGKNPSDVWEIPNVNANHVEKTAHPCQFPVALAERLILALSEPGDIIFDPFTGSASTGIAALRTGRRFLGAEVCESYCTIADARYADYRTKALKVRPLDKEIWAPSATDAVARKPAHFL